MRQRASGILMHIASLPSPYGIGTLGKQALDFADFLKKAGQKYWQTLPLGPTGYGDSPYQVFSMYAGNPYLIDLDTLVREDLLLKSEAEAVFWGSDPRRIDYGALWLGRGAILRKAYARSGDWREQIDAFRGRNPWIEDYALFMALKRHFGDRSWLLWEDGGLRLRAPEILAEYRERLAGDVDYHVFVQYCFFRQWAEFKAYVAAAGVKLIGDLPIYVSADSADVWSHPQFFQLDRERRPVYAAGVPPDYFSQDGQLWGNPLYDWDALKADGYRLWLDRFRAAAALFDVIRIDHFRGFESYWRVPAGEKTARNGEWVPGPGMDFIHALKANFPDTEIIAEDLGEQTPGLAEFVKASGFPGIKVMQFAFDSGELTAEAPHSYPRHCVCFTGTHDNDTAAGWIQGLSSRDARAAGTYLGFTHKRDAPWALIRGGMATAADLFVAQMQDYLELPSGCRTNLPGTTGANWRWRMLPGENTVKLARRIAYLTRVCQR
jgi:4-alpha-glucanotransferase